MLLNLQKPGREKQVNLNPSQQMGKSTKIMFTSLEPGN